MADEKPCFYAIIPANIRYDNNLTPNSKLLYGEITALTNEKGYSWASNNYFAELYGVSKTSISKWIASLEKQGYISIEKIDMVERLKNKSLHGLGIGQKECTWCGIQTAVLHKHHYPIPKAMGGIKTVDICPNCHHEFHFSDNTIKLLLSEKELKTLIDLRGDKNE